MRNISVLSSYKDYKGSLSKKQFNDVVKSLGEEIAKELILGNKIKLPKSMGSLRIYKRKQTKAVNFQVTKKYYGEHNKNNPDNKKVAYTDNKITKGFFPFLYWSKHRTYFKNKLKYDFFLSRPNVRRNTYNKNHPEINLIDYFRKTGFRTYMEFNKYLIDNE